MENVNLIERFGELTKEEPLSSLAQDLVMPDTVVLEATSPFFGYYNDAPMANKEPYLFFVLEECHGISTLFRASLEVGKKVNYRFTADLGTVSILNQNWPVIRVRDCKKYCRIKRLQQLFGAEGLKFKKGHKKIVDQMAVVQLQKFFHLQPVGDQIFLDGRDSNKGYFVLPRYVNWDAFKELTTEAKYDTSILFFDAASALYIENKSITDMVRIYREHLSIEKLQEIRARYLKLMG
ncbi:MAG: hypothetical protein R6U86_06135 [Bacteroidales bacterium]